MALPKLGTGADVIWGLHEIVVGSQLESKQQIPFAQTIQETAIRALGLCASKDAATQLLKYLDDERLRNAYEDSILVALAHTADPRAQSILVDRIRRSDNDSNEAVSNIGALGGIARILQDREPKHAGNLQRVLEIKKLLRSLCSATNHPEVLGTAAMSLARITTSDDEQTVKFLRTLLPELRGSDRQSLRSVLDHHLIPKDPQRPREEGVEEHDKP